MKKPIIILTLIFYCLCCSFLLYSINLTKETNANEVLYGQIVRNNSCLKRTPIKINDFSNSYFLLEESYFVKILNEESDFYYVEYLDLKGYIEKSAINLVNEIPSSPFLDNISFDIIKDSKIYSEPIINKNNIIDYALNQEKVFYYGKIYGEEIYENSGNVWYYCKIIKNDKSINGYIHSSFTNNLTPIIQNDNITTNYISKETVNTMLELNLSTQAIIIITISLPILFISFLFFKGFKKF